MRFVDLTGQRFGRLYIAKRAPDRGRETYYQAECDCGEKPVVGAGVLKRGDTTSCGCVRREMLRGKPSRGREEDPVHVARKYAYKTRRSHARDCKREFELSIEQFDEIATKPCAYCGIVGSMTTRPYVGPGGVIRKGEPAWALSVAYSHNGLDRVDNTRGYTLDNVASCCTRCNTAKSSMTVEEWNDWVDRIARHNGYTKRE